MHLIEALTADQVWCEAAHRIKSELGTVRQPGRGGDTLELLHACLVVNDPTQRWVVNREPAINPAFALAEVVWILSGRNDSAFLNFWNPALPNYAGRGPSYYGAYGHRLRYRFGIDQIRFAFETLRECPDSRQVVLQIWDAASDLPIENGKPRSEDIPCNVSSLLKIRGGRLEWVQIMRSNDLILGWPHNVVQFTTLQEMIAGWLGLRPGSYIHFSDSLHLYVDQLGTVPESFLLKPQESTDRWNLTYSETIDVVHDIGSRMDAIRQSTGDVGVIEALGSHEYSVDAATNLLVLVSADAARRAGAQDLAEALMERCTNPALKQLWMRWVERHQGAGPDDRS